MSRGRPPLTAAPRVTTTTRLPQDLHDWISERAAEHSGSFNNELCRALYELKRMREAQVPISSTPDQQT